MNRTFDRFTFIQTGDVHDNSKKKKGDKRGRTRRSRYPLLLGLRARFSYDYFQEILQSKETRKLEG